MGFNLAQILKQTPCIPNKLVIDFGSAPGSILSPGLYRRDTHGFMISFIFLYLYLKL